MPLWVLELYDEWYSSPIIIGVYTTFDKAQAAYSILMRQLKEQCIDMEPEKRYCMAICPIRSDTFIDAALAWVHDN